jgi:hypothetical protein
LVFALKVNCELLIHFGAGKNDRLSALKNQGRYLPLTLHCLGVEVVGGLIIKILEEQVLFVWIM